MGRFRIYGCQVKFSVDFIKNANTVSGRETIPRTCRVYYNLKRCSRCTVGRCTSHVGVAHDCGQGPRAEGQRPVPIAQRSLADSSSLHTANK